MFAAETTDPRIRRTRKLLQDALGALLETRDFHELSVQEIAETATVNRATFYDHYPDKSSLLECLVASRFRALLEKRGIKFDGTCSAALKAIILGVCDYLAGTLRADCERQRDLEPFLEVAVISVVRNMILEGMKQHRPAGAPSAEMISAMASWAIYGGAKEWVRTPDRCRPEDVVETVLALVSPILGAAAPSSNAVL